MNRSDLLLVGQTPPPYHGQSVVTAMLFEHQWEGMKVERLRMAYSASLDSVGSASLGKIFHLISLIFQTWRILLTRHPRILYYLPASPGVVPVLRDLVYLGSVRWFFSRVVFHYHAGGLDQFVDGKGWLRGIARFVYGKADASIEVNSWLKPTGVYFQAKENVTVMNGVKVSPQVRKRERSERFQLLYVGLLCEEKGILELVEMASMLNKRGHDFEIKLVGGWVSPEFERETKGKVESLSLADHFVWAGVLQGGEKWQAYADADCFIFPTHHPTETFGMVLIEAMAYGLPVIATRWRGVPTVLGDSALLCDVHSPNQCADALERVIGNENLKVRMGAASLERYRKQFTEEQFLMRMNEVFNSVLSK